MMQKIRIGFLSPYSSINPSMNKQIMDGFFAALPSALLKEQAFEFLPVYIGQGKRTALTDAVNRLLYFDNVDVVSGIINYRTAGEIIGLIEKSGKLGFFFDQGENIPTLLQVSDRVFFNSLQLWQSQYALGNWAFKEFGDKGMIAMAMYDSGYHLQSSFRQGAVSAGSVEIDYLLLRDDHNKATFNTFKEHFYSAVAHVKPAFIHAIFCGNDVLEFLDAYDQAPFKSTIPLLITAHMASDEVLSRINVAGIRAYSASMYNYNSESEHNRKFRADYAALTGQKASVYALMGYEMGTAFKDVYTSISKKDWKAVAECFKTQTLKSSRGIRSFYHGSKDSIPIIDIEKIEFQGLHTVNKIVVSQGKSVQFNNKVFDEIHNENVTGWLNPYLCV